VSYDPRDGDYFEVRVPSDNAYHELMDEKLMRFVRGLANGTEFKPTKELATRFNF